MTTSKFWHPFADMKAITENGAFVVDRAEGAYIFDTAGRRYLDATASLWYCSVGHGREEIGAAVHKQMNRLAAYSTFGDFTNQPIEELGERLATLAPFEDGRAFFTSGGSDSVDTAVKLARRYWAAIGQPNRRVVISRDSSYHGMHLAGTSMAGIEPNRANYNGDMFSDVRRVSWDSTEELEKTIESVGPENVAAFFCEPVVGAGGIFYPPEGYFDEVQRICRESGVLLVADEVVTGFGRMGTWFASQYYGIEPDMVITAKGLTSGYLPMGALLVNAKVAEPFYDGTAGLWRHGYTYSGHPAVAAAALANLDIMENEGLVDQVGEKTPQLAEAMGALADHPLVSEVRTGQGLLAAVQIDPGVIEQDPGLPARVIAALRLAGVVSRTLNTFAIHVSPPFIITQQQMQDLAAKVREALDSVS